MFECQARLTREHIEVRIADLMKFGMNVVFEKIFDPYFFLSAMVDVEGVKTTLKVGGMKHILLNISEIIEDIVFV